LFQPKDSLARHLAGRAFGAIFFEIARASFHFLSGAFRQLPGNLRDYLFFYYPAGNGFIIRHSF